MPAPIPFGRYLLLNRLAIGGMAEIFLAKAVGAAGFERVCVIKRVLPHLAKDPEFVKMFLDEARLAARLHHPGIVQIHELGREGSDYFIAMEYLAGEDAASLMLQARKIGAQLPVEVAVKIVAAAAEALHYAHEFADPRSGPLGIVHRDISPSNIFVTYQGAVKVLDFGVARAEGRLASTEAGTTKGKISYMSPEQVLGKRVDRRTDVWALGVCLHELLTGERLFTGGDGAMDRVRMVCEAPIPAPSSRRPGLPRVLDQLVATALARKVEERFASADALRAELDAFLGDRTYVPQGQLFGTCFRELFGEAYLREALARTAEGPAASESSGTQSLPGGDDRTGSAESASSRTEVVPRVRQPGGRRWLGAVGLAAAAAVMAAAVYAVGLKAVRGEEAVDGEAPAAATAARAGPSETSGGGGAESSPSGAAEDERGPPASLVEATAGEAPPAADGEAAPRPEQVRPVRAGARPSSRSVGRLTLESNVPVEVHLGRKLLGRTPLRAVALPEGRHRLRLSNGALGVAREVLVTIEAGEDLTHRASFGQGTLHIDAVPWAEVWLDRKKLGFTPLAGQKVWEGEHRVRLVGPTAERTVKVRVEPGQTVAVRETLGGAGGSPP